MGSNNGTGHPISFRCAICRREHWDHERGYHVVLTGRTKTMVHRGQRQSLTNREYQCQDCKHIGWSTHIDLERI